MEEIPIEKAAIDSKVELKSKGTNYRGTVVFFDKNDGKISLKDVEYIKDDGKPTPMLGQLVFFRDDIEDIRFHDVESVRRKMDPTYLLMKPFRKPMHLRGQNVPTDDEILKIGRPEMDAKDEQDDDQDFKNAASMTSLVIDQLGDEFNNAMIMLKQQKLISIAAEGVQLSRNGELCWLAIDLQNRIYLFDMVALGEDGFKEGLMEILQSTKILKIMHDCRFLSDYLFHKHQIFLQNVWDTQVARIVVFKQQHSGDLPRYLDSLPKSLQDILGVDPNQFPMLWYRSFAMETDQAIWRYRPLSDDLRKVLESQVNYLYELRKALMEKMNMEMHLGVDIHLKAVRDASNAEIPSMLNGQFLLPKEFFKPPEASRERPIGPKKVPAIDPLTGARESMGRLSYWNVRFSRDAWHGKKTVQGENSGEGDVGEHEEEVDAD